MNAGAPTDGGIPTSSSENILLELDGATAIITLNRPEKLNAVTEEMSIALVEIAEWANDDDRVRVVILTGAGERAFCAGSDIRNRQHRHRRWFCLENQHCEPRDRQPAHQRAEGGHHLGREDAAE